MIICIAYCHRLPVVQAEPFKKVISKAISHLTKQVQNAKALIDGVLVFTQLLSPYSAGEVKKNTTSQNNLHCLLEFWSPLVLFVFDILS